MVADAGSSFDAGASARDAGPDASVAPIDSGVMDSDAGAIEVDSGTPFDAGTNALLPVDVTVTADNAYSFGYGTAQGMTTFVQGQRAQSAGEIFNCGPGPDAYQVPASAAPRGAYLYIVTWDDLSVTQGVLGQFVRGPHTLLTGAPGFEVCATGVDLHTSTIGPSQAEVNAQIANCNAGTGDRTTTSGGWVNRFGAVTAGAVGALVIGELNDTAGGTFPPACPTGSSMSAPMISSQARWMWYSPGGITNPFQSTGANTFRAYLIFRIASETIGID